MRREVSMTGDLDKKARDHLLRHYRQNTIQEDICFGLWYPSQGKSRLTAVLNEVLLPQQDEVQLHGNASFEGRYVTRAVREARKRCAGLAMMHSHPSPGWQALSAADLHAERDDVAFVAQATGQPLVGMTIGDDGYWSARFWFKENSRMVGTWCPKVRVLQPNRYKINWKPSSLHALGDTSQLTRTLETWGVGFQQNIQNLRIGVVGVGSVGSLVAETLARIGVSEITLIDPDRIETHNLDRFLYGKKSRIGELKVIRAKTELAENSTASRSTIRAIQSGIEFEDAYLEALDCDLIVSCVDRPVARDVLNYIAIAHLIPVIEGGVAVDVASQDNEFNSARWRSHIVIPGNACLRCTGQYNSSEVVAELDGSLDDPSYLSNLPPDQRPQNQNVFPFSLGSASMQANLMLRYLLGKDWWPQIQRQEYKFISAKIKTSSQRCGDHCSFLGRIATGDQTTPRYLKRAAPPLPASLGWRCKVLSTLCKISLRLRLRARDSQDEAEPVEERI